MIDYIKNTHQALRNIGYLPQKQIIAKKTQFVPGQQQEKKKRNRIDLYNSVKKAWLQIDDKLYFYRSRWEMNWAYYLQCLKDNGEIKDWQYEADIFFFDNIKRGTKGYKPDFKILTKEGTIVYHEVKGFMDEKSNTKLKRMARYHPNVKIKLIRATEYKKMQEFRHLFRGWIE